MGPLSALNPFFWKYRGRLLLGFLFVLLTNVFAVFAPVVIGEGINALEEAYSRFLRPLSEGADASALFLDASLNLPPTLGRIAEWMGWSGNGFACAGEAASAHVPKNFECAILRFMMRWLTSSHQVSETSGRLKNRIYWRRIHCSIAIRLILAVFRLYPVGRADGREFRPEIGGYQIVSPELGTETLYFLTLIMALRAAIQDP